MYILSYSSLSQSSFSSSSSSSTSRQLIWGFGGGSACRFSAAACRRVLRSGALQDDSSASLTAQRRFSECWKRDFTPRFTSCRKGDVIWGRLFYLYYIACWGSYWFCERREINSIFVLVNFSIFSVDVHYFLLLYFIILVVIFLCFYVYYVLPCFIFYQSV